MHNIEAYNQNIAPEIDTEKIIEGLRLANRQKDELLSMATHQMRANIAAIRGHASLILEGDCGETSAVVTETVKIISKSAESLSKTVNDFLDLSKMELGEMRYYRKDFDFTHLTDEVIKEMRKTVEDAGLELRLNIPQTPLVIHGDKAKLKHVLVNLLDNACKYTKSGWIEISLDQSPASANTSGGTGKILFSIKDSGVGIKPETIPSLFQKFTRDVDANKANIHGTGLGLYVAKKMVEANNGRVWAESEGEGKGSQFYVEVPSV